MKILRWACFFALCWGFAFVLAQTHGCAGPGAGYDSQTVTETPGKTVTEKIRASVAFPANLDAMRGFKIGRDTVEIGSLSNFRVKAGGWMFPVIGIALLLIGALVAFGAVPYVSAIIGGPQPVAGGIVAGVGGFCLIWPTIQDGVGVIVLVSVAVAAALGLALVVGRFFQAVKVKGRAVKAKAKLDSEGKADEGTAALRIGDPALDKAMAAASAARNSAG